MADRQWTPEQKLAIEAESGTLLVSAAAGSGKTSVLVERIVRKLTSETDPCAPDELLVVTFTNAAAAEMRARIHKRLGEKMNVSPEEYRRLAPLRARLDEMQVCTMDSFCMRLVRDNFHACGVEPDFKILDKGPEDVLKAQAVSETIEFLYENDREDFLPLARLFEAGRADRKLAAGIMKLSDFSMSEPVPEVWLDKAADHFLDAPAEDSVWGRGLISHFADGVSYALSLCEKMTDELTFDDELIKKYGDMCVLDKMQLEKLFAVLKTGTWDEIRAAFLSTVSELGSRRFAPMPKYNDDIHRSSGKACRSEIKDIVSELCKMIPADEEEHREDVSVLRPIADELVKAVKMFNRILLEKKKEKNSYSFSDISHRALELLYDSLAEDKKTELARELSAGLKEILIDEYQDTNRAQDTLFTCLSDNGNNMFMVGDVKQSIYRFRLASPEIFIEKCRDFPHYDGIAKRSKIILGKNFRSRRGVTEAVNYMFSAVLSEKCGEIEYNDDERLNFAANYKEHEESDVEFHLIDNADRNEYECEAEYIARLIKERVENGLTVSSGETSRPAEYSDFCILMRSASRIAPVYAAALRKRGIPVCLDSKEGFFETAEIRMALSLLRAVNDPSKDIDLLAVMMSPAFGFTPDEAAKVKIFAAKTFGSKKYSLYNALKLCAEKMDGKYASLVAALNGWRKNAACENAAETLRRIYDDTALMSIAGSMSDGNLRKANLRTLMLSAEKFSADGGAGLSSFVRYLDLLIENGADIGKTAAGAQGSGVRIMTMHGSKGLEFPFVFLAGLTKQSGADRGSELTVSHELGIGLKRREPENIKLYDTLSSVGVKRACDDAEISEELRIYYVAMTRAKEKLFIVAAPKNCTKKLSEMQMCALPEKAIPPYAVKTTSPAWQWFSKVFARHPEAGALRISSAHTVPADFPLTAVLAEPPEIEEPAPEEKKAPDEALVEKMTAGMNFSYAFAPVSRALSKHTASDLSSGHFMPAFFGQSVPAFMFSSELTPAERGTATHRFMQFCDFSACETDAQAECRRLVAEGRLTEAQGRGVDMESVADFFRSEVYGRIRSADNVWRERQFTVARSVCDLDPLIPKEFAEEKTVVIGKTDLIFTEGDTAVIVDYKTDNVDDISVLRSRYKEQMDMYIDAVKRSLGLTVNECILYSIKLKQWITV